MGALLESGLVGNIGLKHLKVIKEDTINKWDKLGFLEGLKGHLKENVAQLYENQASFLINEATSEGSNGAFETVVFPIVRRVFSKLLANDIVSVQAMNLPIGKLFFFVPRIQGYDGQLQTVETHYAPIGAPNGPDGGRLTQDTQVEQLTTHLTLKIFMIYSTKVEAALDPPGLFDYSKGQWTAVTAATNVQVWSGSTLENAGDNNSQYTATTGTRKVIIKMCDFNRAGQGKLIGPDGNEMDTETFLSDLKIIKSAGLVVSESSPCTVDASTPLLFRVVTQIYGKGIVKYGNKLKLLTNNRKWWFLQRYL
jgi:hypothetical protein